MGQLGEVARLDTCVTLIDSADFAIIISLHTSKVIIEISRVNQCDTSVKSCNFSKLGLSMIMTMINIIFIMFMVINLKKWCNLMGFRNSRSFNQDVIEFFLLSQSNDLLNQVRLQSA